MESNKLTIKLRFTRLNRKIFIGFLCARVLCTLCEFYFFSLFNGKWFTQIFYHFIKNILIRKESVAGEVKKKKENKIKL